MDPVRGVRRRTAAPGWRTTPERTATVRVAPEGAATGRSARKRTAPERVALVLLLAVAASWCSAFAAGPPMSSFEPEQELVLVETSLVAGWRVETYGPPPEALWREMVLRVVGDDDQVAHQTRDAWVQVVTQGEPGRPGEHVAVAPGDDLNRDSGPNLLLEAYSGGAHCCFTYTLLALDQARVTVLMELFTSHAGAVVVDLAGDGRRQLRTADMRYAYEFCSFAESPAPTVVFALEPEAVVVANLAFPEVYHREVVWAFEWLLLQDEDAAPSSHACALAQLVLSLLYGGREAAAEAALVQLYRGDDPAAFRDTLWAIAEASPFFQRP